MWKNRRKIIIELEEDVPKLDSKNKSKKKKINTNIKPGVNPSELRFATEKIILRQVCRDGDALLFKCVYLFANHDVKDKNVKDKSVNDKSVNDKDSNNNTNIISNITSDMIDNDVKDIVDNCAKDIVNNYIVDKNIDGNSGDRDIKEDKYDDKVNMFNKIKDKVKSRINDDETNSTAKTINSTNKNLTDRTNKNLTDSNPDSGSSNRFSDPENVKPRIYAYAYDYEEDPDDFSNSSFTLPISLTLPTFTDERKYENNMSQFIEDTSSCTEFHCPNLGERMREILLPLKSAGIYYIEEGDYKDAFNKIQSFAIYPIDEKKLNLEENLLHACIYVSTNKPKELHPFYFSKLWCCFKENNTGDKYRVEKVNSGKDKILLNILLKIMVICYSNYYYINESLLPVNMFLEMFNIDCIINECHFDLRNYLYCISSVTGKMIEGED